MPRSLRQVSFNDLSIYELCLGLTEKDQSERLKKSIYDVVILNKKGNVKIGERFS